MTAKAASGISEEGEPEHRVEIEKSILTECGGGPFGGTRLTAVRYGAETLMPPHSHAVATVSLVVAGTFLEKIGDGRRVGPGLSVLVKPSGAVHETLCGEHGVRSISLEVPPRVERMLRGKFGVITRIAHEDDPRLTAAMVRLWMRVRGDDAGIGSDEPRLDGPWLLDWWTRFGLLLAARADRRADRRVDRRLGAALAVGAAGGGAQDAADAIGVHPVHLCRLFHEATGRGTAANFRRARVRRAVERMLTTRESLAAVSVAAGFSDQSHMTRDFATEVGVSPGAYRLLLADRV